MVITHITINVMGKTVFSSEFRNSRATPITEALRTAVAETTVNAYR